MRKGSRARQAPTVERVEARPRRRAFLVEIEGTEHIVPYAALRLEPTAADPVADVRPDPDLGLEAFTYRLGSGREDTVHVDAVKEIVRDPAYLQELLLYDLTVAAVEGLARSGLGKRQAARLLGTSPTQLYRLLDPTNHGKSVGQMLALLHLVGREVSWTIGSRGAAEARTPADAEGDGDFEGDGDLEGDGDVVGDGDVESDSEAEAAVEAGVGDDASAGGARVSPQGAGDRTNRESATRPTSSRYMS